MPTPHPLDPHTPPRPGSPYTLWQSLVYSFGHCFINRTTKCYRIPFDRKQANLL